MALLTHQVLDADAIGELFARTRDTLYAYAMAMMLSAPAAEDVVQRAFELAFARRHTFRPDLGTADAWVFGIARHVALDERRRTAHRPRIAAVEIPDDGCPDPCLERADQQRALFAAVNTLDRADREVIALKFWADLSHGEIAGVLGCSESNVGTRLHRAMCRLREVSDDIA